MTIKQRLTQLEKKKKASDPNEIKISIVYEDPDDPEFYILKPENIRMSKEEHDKQAAESEAAGDLIIVKLGIDLDKV